MAADLREFNGEADHVHLLVFYPPKVSVSALVNSFKRVSARMLRSQYTGRVNQARVLIDGLRLIYDTDRDTLLAQIKLIVGTPALRDRLWADQIATQQLILQALSAGQDDQRPSFQTRVTVAACLAAASTAILTWVENDGTPELPDLIGQAFDTLADPGRTRMA